MTLRENAPPALQVLQMDFVWGFLLANPINAPAALTAAVRGPRALLSRSARERALEQ